MKSRTLTCVTAMTLFVALALPVELAAQHTRYKLIDIPTLGGPNGYPSVNGNGTQILNNSGVVSSGADTTTPDPNAPNLCFADCFVEHAFRWHDGAPTDLGALPGINSSAAGAVNARGWSVGQSQNGEIDPLTGFPEIRAVLWGEDGQIIDLGTLGSGNLSLASTLNNGGQVVGFSTINDLPDPFSLFIGASIHPFLWEKGTMQDLGTLGGPDAAALSVNERGQVAGFSFTDSSPNASTGMPTLEPFLWEHGRMISLGTFGGTVGSPGREGSIMINNRGQIIGTSNLPGDKFAHAFVWQKGVMTDLHTLGGPNSFPLWINDAGEIVGEADTSDVENARGEFPHHAFLWRNGVMKNLGTLGSTSHAEAINDRGQVVGRSRLGSEISPLQHAFLWEHGGPMIDLNTLIPATSSLQLVDAVNINERGEILVVELPSGVQPGQGNGRLGLLVPCAGDEEACNDDAEAASAATQNNLAPISPITSAQGRAASGIAAWRTRMAQRYHIPGLGASPRD